ncbi:MAG: hypothetical protein ACI39M_19295 [Streptomyces albidoflavus]
MTLRIDRADLDSPALVAFLTDHLAAARSRGVRRVSLETGSPEFFLPARTMYARNGFTECEPFGDYVLDPYSVFMTREL